jgi:hypothetical protein
LWAELVKITWVTLRSTISPFRPEVVQVRTNLLKNLLHKIQIRKKFKAAPQIAAPTPGDCTFEVDECGWINVQSRERMDDIDWERVSGLSTSEGRPKILTFDHTLSSDKGSQQGYQKSD